MLERFYEMEKLDQMYVYSWHIDEKEEEATAIRLYGLSPKNENVCLRINDFTPYVYLELPTHVYWTEQNAQVLGNKLDQIMGQKKPIKKRLVMKRKLYGASYDKNNNPLLYPYLFVSFAHPSEIKILSYKIAQPLNILGIGMVKLKMHEQDANPILQMSSICNLPMAGWISFKGDHVPDNERVTIADHEYTVKYRTMQKLSNDKGVKPTIMSFDIEVNSSNPAKMPDVTDPDDKVFQISCIIAREGDTVFDKYLLSLFDPDPDIVGDDVSVFMYDTEADLLCGFADLINDKKVNVIVGYNILGFDLPYMIGRSKLTLSFPLFMKHGFTKYTEGKEKTIKWSSSAYKNQEFQYVDAEGRLYIDLLPLIRRDYKMSNYKLKTVSEFFLGENETKDPLSVQGIFKCYRIGRNGWINENNEKKKQAGRRAMGIVGKYCVQDSVLVLKLMAKLQTWIALCEMATVCCVPVFSLYTQGQQIRVFSQVYRYCMYNNIVVEKDAYITKENERYVGAYVVEPEPGVYDRVVPFDFSSMYPTIMIAYNIDPSTWVTDNSIPDSKCHVMEWEDHVWCEHDPKVIRKNNITKYIDSQQAKLKILRDKRDKLTKKPQQKQREEIVTEINSITEELSPYIKERSEIIKGKAKFPMCAKRKYRFLKDPKGVFPAVLQDLLDARKRTRLQAAQIKQDIASGKLKSSPELDVLLNILDKRQLSYKVSCNSMYGAMGVRRGYLPFMAGAMCVTYMGRTSIQKVSKVIQTDHGGQLVYGDSDSSYQIFPHLKTASETWEHAERVSNEVSALFPKPMKLEFEEVIYWRFFILTKKRYMYQSCNKAGDLNTKIGKKGVLLARRDNSAFVRNLYESVIQMIFQGCTYNDVTYHLIVEINKLCSNSLPYTDFIVTKAVGDSGVSRDGEINVQKFTKPDGTTCGLVGDYKVPLLCDDEKERKKQLLGKQAQTESEYYLKCLPAQVQLAELMRRRGQRVDAGSRLEYVITSNKGSKARQYEKIESADYFKAHKDVLHLDFMYYLKLAATPIDQVLNVIFSKHVGFKTNFVLDQYNYRLKNRDPLLYEIKSLYTPKLIFN